MRGIKMVLDQGTLSRLLETAVVAARLAGQRAMEELNYTKFSIKNDTELVTPADSHCQKIIVDRIKETYPDHGFLAEECTEEGIFKQSPRGTQQFWWVIDPIDGTNNFAHGIVLFAISLAVLYEGEPVAGVVFQPATDLMFTAVQNGQAQLNGRHISAGEEKISQFCSVGIDSHFTSPMPKWIAEIMEKTRFRNFGTTALQLAYVASGGLVATIACTPKLWDLAAGAFVATMAGAKCTNWKGDSIFPIDMNSYQGSELPLIAANKKVHEELTRLLRQ